VKQSAAPRRDSAPAGQRDRRGFRKPQDGTPSSSPASGTYSPREPQRAAEGGSARAPQERRGAGDRPGRGGSAQQDGGPAPSFPRRNFSDKGNPAGASRRQYSKNRDLPPPPYESPYFDVTFYPEDSSFDALAKTIRSSYRTLELFEIARTVVAKNDRFIAHLTRKPALATSPAASGASSPTSAKQPIYIARPDGVPFDSEEAVVNYVISQHLGQFFETEQVEVAPPKGNFQVINRCGVTGELLGPPNYHRYTQIVQQHFDARIKHLSFDAFRAKIETLRDEAAVAEWLEKMKTVTRYTWRGNANKTKAAAAPKPAATTEETKAEPEATPAPETASVAPNAEAAPIAAAATAPLDTGEAVPSTSPAADAATPDVSPQPEATSGTPETGADDDASPPQDSEAKDGEAKDAPPALDSLEEARVYLLTHARDKIYRTSDTARFHGNLLEKLPDGEIRRAIEGALERQRRFPLDTANGLRGRLRREHFTIFKKGSKGISYVCAVKRKFRTPGQTFADSISALIDFIEKHPMVLVSELPERFLGIKTPAPAADSAPRASDATTAAASSADATAANAATAPETQAAVDDAKADAVAERAALHRLQLDLRWLVTEGYVTEFIDGRLFAPPPIPASRKNAAETPDAHDPENFPEAPKPSKPENSVPRENPSKPESPAARENPSKPETSSQAEAAPAPKSEAPAASASETPPATNPENASPDSNLAAEPTAPLPEATPTVPEGVPIVAEAAEPETASAPKPEAPALTIEPTASAEPTPSAEAAPTPPTAA